MVLFIHCLFVFIVLLFVCCAAPLDLEEGEICDTKSGGNWRCTKLDKCPQALQSIRQGTLPQPVICKFVGFEPIVCCQIADAFPNTVTQTPNTNTPVVNRFKSKDMCEKYAKNVFQETASVLFTSDSKEKTDTCAAVEALITNGKNTEPREYPHMALIGYGTSKKSAKWLCGGSLISEKYILTAAHCTNPGSRWGAARWVLLGEYNTATTNDDVTGDAKTAVYEIAERINHPEYKPPKLYNDIALYKLKKNVEFNAYVRPACLGYEPKISNKDAIATGWGHTEWGGKASDILQKVRLNLLETQLCQNNFISAGNAQKQLPNGIIEDSMLCAGDLVSGKDTCQGDSGGPLQVRLEEPYCMYRQIGITSFGKSCGGNTPAIYTRVSYYIPWIEQIVWP